MFVFDLETKNDAVLGHLCLLACFRSIGLGRAGFFVSVSVDELKKRIYTEVASQQTSAQRQAPGG